MRWRSLNRWQKIVLVVGALFVCGIVASKPAILLVAMLGAISVTLYRRRTPNSRILRRPSKPDDHTVPTTVPVFSGEGHPIGPPPGIPVAIQEAHSSLTFVEALDSCSRCTAAIDDLAVAIEGATTDLTQINGILATRGLSWFKRRRLKRDRDKTQKRLDNLHAEHNIAAVEVSNLTALLETAMMAQTTEQLRIAMIGTPTLPVIRPNLILAYNEIARFEGSVALEKSGKGGTELIPGSLVLTDRRILFESPHGINETPMTNIMRVAYSIALPSRPFVTLTGRGTNQKYLARDAVRIAVIVDIVVRMQNRHIVPTSPEASRSIPQQVKIAVWQRDGGRCVQCGSDQYLEYDHIIPWSKGGASTVNNLQLLCRSCNAAKSDRI